MSTRIGWAKHNGAGEIVFRQAGHPANDAELPGQGWTPICAEVQMPASLEEHIQRIEDALDDLATDPDVPTDEYVEAMERIAKQCEFAARAATEAMEVW